MIGSRDDAHSSWSKLDSLKDGEMVVVQAWGTNRNSPSWNGLHLEFADDDEGDMAVTPGVEYVLGLVNVGPDTEHLLKQTFPNGFLMICNLLTGRNHSSRRSIHLVEDKPGKEVVWCGPGGEDEPNLVWNAKQRVVMENVQGVNTLEDGRQILETLTMNKDKFQSIEVPVVVAIAPQDGPGIDSMIYLGQCFGKSVYQVMTVSQETEAFSLDELHGIQGGKMKLEARYDLLGSESYVDFGCTVSLQVAWEGSRSSVSRLLCPPPLSPNRSILAINGCHDDDQPEIKRIQILLKILNFESVAVEKEELEKHDPEWIEKVEAFIQNARSLNPSSSSSETGNARERRDLDFTETLWEDVVQPSKSYLQLYSALGCITKALVRGTCLPFVHKSNVTFFGEFCRQAVQQAKRKQGALEQSLDTSQQSSFEQQADAFSGRSDDTQIRTMIIAKVVELGMWKISRDVESQLGSLNVLVDDQVRVLVKSLSPCAKDVRSSICRLVALCDVLQVLRTLNILQCPRQEMMHICRDALRFYKHNIIKDQPRAEEVDPMRKFPTFLVQLHSHLPWVQSGTIPQPSYWNLTMSSPETTTFCTFTPSQSPLSMKPESNPCAQAAKSQFQVFLSRLHTVHL